MNLASLPGVILDGKYRIERQLGKGGMGAVFQALHLGTTRTVAVKVIVPQFAAHEEFLQRFQREAEAAGRLRHPNVVNVTDFGSTLVDGGQLAYLVMEFLDGENLSDFLNRNPHPASDEILDIVDQVALALDVAHECGIVHRDLKPDNIWLQPNGRGGLNIKVLDFGIAKLHNPVGSGPTVVRASPAIGAPAPGPDADSDTLVMAPTEAGEADTVITFASLRPSTPSAGASLRFAGGTHLQTTVGSVLGTPAYMAPEQCQGANVDAAADIYSLSVIVYQMFCGCLPFEAKSLKELLQKQIDEVPVAPAERDPGIPKRVSDTILRGLAKVPRERPSSVMGFAAQLRAASEGELKLLADGKVVANNHGNCFFPLLLACFAPQVPILYGVYLVAVWLVGRGKISPALAMAAFYVLLFALQFFLSQMYKAGSTLLIDEAAAAGHFQQQWRPQFRKLIRGLPALLATHSRNVLDFRLRSFLAGQLWPVVWASEGLSGEAVLTRAAVLASVQPAAAGALAARQFGILLCTAMLIPCIMALITGSLDPYARTLMSSVHPLAWFAILYPTILTVLAFRFFGPAFFFLYLSARRCLAEAMRFTLPSVSREQRKRRAVPLRPATIAWLTLPSLMALALLYRSIPQVKPAVKLLDAAAEGRNAAVLRELESGTSVNSTDRHGWTPLMYAIAKGDLTFARALVARHADVNAQNSDGVTALLIAVRDHRLPEAEMLIANGAKVEIAEDEGRTALITAAMQSDLAMCKLLLDHGAGPSHRDQTGKTALDYAREERNPEVVALLSAPPTPAR